MGMVVRRGLAHGRADGERDLADLRVRRPAGLWRLGRGPGDEVAPHQPGELARAQGSRQEGVGPGAPPVDSGLVGRAVEDRRRATQRRVAAHTAADVPPVHAGHHDVQEREVRRYRASALAGPNVAPFGRFAT